MPFNGSGTFSIVNTFVPNTTILSSAVNQNFTDIATGLSDCLTRDNQAGMLAIFRAVSGSVSAPGITFNSDTTAGLFLSTTGIVGLVAKSLGLLVNSSIYQVSSAAVQAGGSNYAVGDVIAIAGGTSINAALVTVATLSGTAVATVTVSYPGNYSVVPSNPAAQGSTTGIGTGCTLNLTFATQFTRSVVTNEAGALPWQRLGSSSYVSSLMDAPNETVFANRIGATALINVIGGTFLLPPQGILSPISSTTNPIPATDQTAVTRIYWTPYNGNVCPIYNGTSFATTTSAQLTCDLTAGAQVSGGIYDVYKFLNAGVVTLGFSPSWSAGTAGSVTAGSCARGTSTGGAALAILNGLRVNAVAMTLNNGATTYNVSANQATYLGSIYVNSTAGQINCHVSYGQSRVWGLWNAYNRRPLYLKAGDATASWTISATLGPVNGSANNSMTVFSGLPEEVYDFRYGATAITGSVSAATDTGYQNGIGYNSTTVASGQSAQNLFNINATTAFRFNLTSEYMAPPSLGINVITALEHKIGTTGSFTLTGNGGEGFSVLTGQWRG